VPVYIAPQEVMDRVVGFEIHRGVLAAGERGDPDAAPPLPARGPCRVVVLEALANHDNVGGIFRSAEALGAAAIFIDPRTADPLYRKAIRVSMGSTLTLPFARLSAWPDGLERLAADGFTLAALTPDPRAADIRTFAPRAPERIALLVGTEGAGLSDAARARCSVALRIPMSSAMDSLNAATATAIALFSLS
jgi:tRNA G18 (ribose-2'-O)-methylase SpoU